MVKIVINILKELDKDYPSFKNHIFAIQIIMQGKVIPNNKDQIIYNILAAKD